MTADTTLVWCVEPADWPPGDLLGDEPRKLVAAYDGDNELTDTERSIRDSLREMGEIGDGEILCYGGLEERLPIGEHVDLFDVHEALVEDIREKGGAFGEMVDVLAEGRENGDHR